MMRFTPGATLLAGSLALAACAIPGRGAPAAGDASPRNAVIIDNGIPSEHTGPLLSARDGQVANMRITRTGPCPKIMLRGQTSIHGLHRLRGLHRRDAGR